MKKIKITFGLLITLFIICWFASPYWMLYQINQAIKNNQAGKISQYINYPAVKSSLKPQIHQQLNHKLGLENSKNPLAVYATKLTEKLSNQVVDVAVTPQAIALLLQGKQLKESIEIPQLDQIQMITQYFQQDNPLIAPQASTVQKDTVENSTLEKSTIEKNIQSKEHDSKMTAQYVSMNSFAVTVPVGSFQKTRFIFQRHLFHWKMVEIILE